jgi:hypothetical protein
VAIDKLIDNLCWQVDPDVEDTVLLCIFFKRVLQVQLDSLNEFLGSLEIVDVPLVVGLALVLVAN